MLNVHIFDLGYLPKIFYLEDMNGKLYALSENHFCVSVYTSTGSITKFNAIKVVDLNNFKEIGKLSPRLLYDIISKSTNENN